MEEVSANDVLRFASLFSGRSDAYFDGWKALWQRPSLKVFRDHLSGRIDGIGTYPIKDDCTGKWSCIDLDGPEYTFSRAVDVVDVWQYYGATAFVERSRSKGWHVWSFAKEWTSAETLRYAGLQVAKIAELPSDTEINPKGTDPKATRTGLINTVRLPYPGKGDWQRQVVLDASSALVLSLPTFLDRACASLCSPAVLSHVAGTYRASLTQQARTDRYSRLFGNSPSLLPSRTNQEAMEVLTGKRKVSDNRDNQLYTIAMLMHGINLSYEEALARMEQIWNEQVDQSKDFYPLSQATKKVERAYRSGSV
jgi:hypothetical protein